jgi:hypothetical protein
VYFDAGTKVTATPDWLHEIKQDGYRLIVQREGKRVRVFTRNGYDSTDRYPMIVESALKNRTSSFVTDGEAVLLGVDGISDFNGLHSRQHDDEVQLYAFDILALDGDDLRKSCPLPAQDSPGPGCWRAGCRVSSSARSSRARSGRTCSARPANSAAKAWSRSAAIAPIDLAVHRPESR